PPLRRAGRGCVAGARAQPYPGACRLARVDDPRPAPRTVAPGGVALGERPSRKYLVQGYFCSCSLYDRLADAAERVHESRAAGEPLRLPVFWVAGPVGSGRRVALLFVLSALHARNHRPV